MKNKIILLRSLLERNKIFFEIITATALTTASIFISIKANNIANYANGISEEQTEIMKSENTPRIQIKRDELYTDSTKTNYITKWSIYNNNSKLSNFEIQKEVSYLVLVKENLKEIDLPLVKYLDAGKVSNQNEGLIYEFDNRHCYEYEFLINQELSNHGNTYIKSYIEISYYTISGNKETKFYQILPLIQEISSDEWKSNENDWRNKNQSAITLEHIQKNMNQIKKDIKS
ncbi:hypothetical protein N4T20_02270 [Flavobacterium sp. TR2]|uniref:hypothetical protein n=1 Tax=Flavobacterium sp. TR2 TaxID=2977321 RepID=UPI0021B10EA8|nr:hypothetical protein [Flavobacterium sp. TR2]UWY28760.1 hypothetical protein N4T20_02270 [Flavobacterium sp. TR2]